MSVCDTIWNGMSLCNCSHQFCKNIPVSFVFITTWNQGVFLCSHCIFELRCSIYPKWQFLSCAAIEFSERRGWVIPKGDLEALKRQISCPCWESNHGSTSAQAVAQWLYRLSYPGSNTNTVSVIISWFSKNKLVCDVLSRGGAEQVVYNCVVPCNLHVVITHQNFCSTHWAN